MYRKAKEQKYWYEKDKLEKLDRAITRGMLEAEDQCRIHLSSLKNNIDCSKQIEQKQSLLKNEI
jgi:hypothetical protein